MMLVYCTQYNTTHCCYKVKYSFVRFSEQDPVDVSFVVVESGNG